MSIDGAGESTFMKDAKIAGGIKNHASQDSTYDKWTLSRAGQAEYRSELWDIAGLSDSAQEPQKCLRPSQILKSEAAVEKIMDVLEGTFVNPFSDDLEKDKLYNLASGCPISDESSDCLLTYEGRGKILMDEFKTRIAGTHVTGKKLFNTIERKKWLGFSSNSIKSKIKVKEKILDVAVQRDILGALVANSHEGDSPVDLDKALSYPLAPVSLPLASADGNRRKTNKSKLYDVIEPTCPKTPVSHDKPKKYLIYDLAAVLRSKLSTPNTFRELAIQLLNEISLDFSTIYVACDTYTEKTIKGNERKSRGTSEKLVIRSPSVRIPSDFQNFLNNGDNKERLFEIIEEVWSASTNLLGHRVVFFARASICTKIDENGCSTVDELASNHEEADTKVVYLLKHAIEQEQQPDGAAFVVRSNSGDIDIPVILLSNDLPGNTDIILDSGKDKHRKNIMINKCSMPSLHKKALVGMHAFTGCDQISSFLRKGKVTCWKVLEKNPHLFDSFALLGTQLEVGDALLDSISEFVCRLYGEKKTKDVNQARRNIFWRALKNKKKIIDLSLLPPCRSSLAFHTRRANYLSHIWRQASVPSMVTDLPQNHGWDNEFNYTWTEEVYPEDVACFLANTSSIRSNNVESSVEGNDDETSVNNNIETSVENMG